MRLSPGLKAFNRATQRQMLSDPAYDGAQVMSARASVDTDTNPQGASDGRGGTIKDLGNTGSDNLYTPGPVYGYRLQVKPAKRGERDEDDQVTEESLYDLYLPWNAVVQRRDQILLVQQNRTFEVLQPSDVSDRSTLMVVVKEQK